MEPPALAALAARADLELPATTSGAGAHLLRAAAREGRAAVPRSPEQVWAAWVDLGLWRRARSAGEVRDLTDLAVDDLVAVADRLAPAPADGADGGSRPARVLDSEQDARLRTLTVLRQLGELAPELRALERELRSKDQRADVRPPAQVAWPR